MGRNRSQGWVHAKLSGHGNESLIMKKLNEDPTIRKNLAKRLSKINGDINSVDIGGITEKNVPCIIGGSTKSKTDIKIVWSDSSISRLSIKKSLGGQVFLIKTSRFIEGFEAHYEAIPDQIKIALLLYFGEHSKTEEVLKSISYSDKRIRDYEIRKNRLVWMSLVLYDKEMAYSLLQWIKVNIQKIVSFCFSMGMTSDKVCWADYIWYKNLLGEDETDIIIPIVKLAIACSTSNALETIKPGKINGGSTILLPFGFVQWHQGQMQFHHNLDKILDSLQLQPT